MMVRVKEMLPCLGLLIDGITFERTLLICKIILFDYRLNFQLSNYFYFYSSHNEILISLISEVQTGLTVFVFQSKFYIETKLNSNF